MNSLKVTLIDASGSMKGNAMQFNPATGEHSLYNYTGGEAIFNEVRDYASSDPENLHYNNYLHHGSIQLATIDGFNKFLQIQQLCLDDCAMYVAQFAGGYRVTNAFVPIGKVAPLTTKTYSANWGGTNVYDAVWQAIDDVEAKIASLDEDERPTSVTFTLQTDGQDCGSKHNAETTKNRLAKKIKEGWHVLFLATQSDKNDQTAIYTAKLLGFPDEWILPYTADDTSIKAFEETAISIMESLVAPGAVTGLHMKGV